MPTAMATTKTMTPGDNVARFSIAGPGQSPTRPQPIPNSTEPTTSGRSISFCVGHWLFASMSGARRRAKA